MLSQTTEYALRAVVHLAVEGEGYLTAQKIAEATQVPAFYISKVMGALADRGIVEGLRGKHGGFRLSRAPREITVLDVVDAVDPIPRIDRCPLGIKDHGTRLCSLHRLLDNAASEIRKSFGAASIADLIRKRAGASNPLCRADSPLRARKKAPRRRG